MHPWPAASRWSVNGALRAAIDDDLAALDELKRLACVEADERVVEVQERCSTENGAREARREARQRTFARDVAGDRTGDRQDHDLGHLGESCREALNTQSLEEVAAAMAEMPNEQGLPSAASVAAAERAGADEGTEGGTPEGGKAAVVDIEAAVEARRC